MNALVEEPKFRYFRAEVLRVRWLAPNFVRITVGGPKLQGFQCVGSAPKIKVFLPTTGSADVAMPEISATGFRFDPGVPSPVVRTYTVRAHRPEAQEIDLDFVVHSHGPAGQWAANASVGSRLVVSDGLGDAPPDAQRLLLIGDLSALPAAMTILEALLPDQEARLLIRIDRAEERVPLESVALGITSWVVDGGESLGLYLTEALKREIASMRPEYVWAAGEALSLKSLRRVLRSELGFAADTSKVMGYWRRDTNAEVYDSEVIGRATELLTSGQAGWEELDEVSIDVA